MVGKGPGMIWAIFGHFFQLPQHKSAHISARRQHKHMLWVFIFLVHVRT